MIEKNSGKIHSKCEGGKVKQEMQKHDVIFEICCCNNCLNNIVILG